VQRRQINRCGPRRSPKNIGSACEQLLFPIRDLVGVNLKLRGQFRQRPVLA